MSRKTYTTQVRLLLCQSCGAPLEVPAQGAPAIACSYCQAQNQVARGRSHDAPLAPPAMPIDENERLRRLREQDGRPFVPPASLMPLLAGNGFHPAKVEEAFYIYQATRTEVLTTHSPEAAERLFALTLIANTHLGMAGDHMRRRAILETSLETLGLPRHQQVLRCLLASASAREGDLASAEQWLAPCNMRSDEIESDSALRVARALIDTTRGDFSAVVQCLGPYDDGYPIADTWDPTCAVLRANALERLGDLPGAVNALRTRMFKQGNGARATMEAIIRAHSELALCSQSFGLAAQQSVMAAPAVISTGASASGGGVGSIFYFVGIGVCVFGVLLALGLGVPMVLGGMASGEGDAGIGVGVGAGVFSAFMALITTVPLGLIFAVVGARLRRAQR